MWQRLFEIPGTGITVYGYGLMLFFAFLGGMKLAARQAKRSGVDPENIYDLALWLFIGGLVGARALYVWQYWGTRIKSWSEVYRLWEGGIVFYGSVIGGTLAFLNFWLRRRFPFRPTLDAIAPALALGIALGRFGCFLNGCCYGDRCDYPWAVSFPRLSPPWADQVHRGEIPATAAHSLPVHPTQLYSALDGLVLLALLLTYYPLRKRDGEVMALLIVTYPVTRFIIEGLRNDESVFFAGMTISQTISVGLFVLGLAFWGYLLRQPRELYADRAKPEVPLTESNAPASAPA